MKAIFNKRQHNQRMQMEALLSELFPDSTGFIKEGYIHSGFVSFKLDNTGQRVESIGYDPET